MRVLFAIQFFNDLNFTFLFNQKLFLIATLLTEDNIDWLLLGHISS